MLRSRRTFLKALGMAAPTALLAACAMPTAVPAANTTSKGALELSRVTFWGIRDPQEGAQLALAQALGLFKAEGIEVDLKWIVNGSDLAGLVGSGQDDMICESGLNALYATKLLNTPMHYMMPLADISGTQCLVLGPNTKIDSPKQLEGKKVGMAAGAGVEAALIQMSKQHGVDYGKLQIINLQPADQLPALGKGDIDAMAVWQPFALNAIKAGGRLYFTGNRSYIGGSEEKVNWMYLDSGFLVKDEFVRKNPNTVKALMRALIAATNYINGNPIDKSAGILSKVLDVPVEDLIAIMKQNIYTNTMKPYMVDGTQNELQRLFELKAVPALYRADDAYDLALLRDIAPEHAALKSP